MNIYITDINSTELHTELIFIYNEVLLSSLHIKFTYTSYSYLLNLLLRSSLVAHLVKNPPAIQEIPIRFWAGKIHWRRNRLPTPVLLGAWGASLIAQLSACKAGDLGLIPGREDPLENEMATLSSILAWRIPWTEEPGRPHSMELQELDMT